MLLSDKIPLQGNVKNYLGKQKTVKAPLHWKSAPDHPKTKLAYITDKEEKILVDLNLYNSMDGKPNTGPHGIPSLNGGGGGSEGAGTSDSGGDSSSNATDTGDMGSEAANNAASNSATSGGSQSSNSNDGFDGTESANNQGFGSTENNSNDGFDGMKVLIIKDGVVLKTILMMVLMELKVLIIKDGVVLKTILILVLMIMNQQLMAQVQ
jgi:hypothetical protein